MQQIVRNKFSKIKTIIIYYTFMRELAFLIGQLQ